MTFHFSLVYHVLGKADEVEHGGDGGRLDGEVVHKTRARDEQLQPGWKTGAIAWGEQIQTLYICFSGGREV